MLRFLCIEIYVCQKKKTLKKCSRYVANMFMKIILVEIRRTLWSPCHRILYFQSPAAKLSFRNVCVALHFS